MAKTFAEKRFFHWVEDDIAVSLRNRSGSYGGGSEVLVLCCGIPEGIKENDEDENQVQLGSV